MSGREVDSIDALLRPKTAKKIVTGLKAAGYKAEVADHGYAIKVSDADGNQLSIVWMPIAEPTPTGLGDQYLWGKTGDEHQAPDYTGVNDLVQLIARTLQ